MLITDILLGEHDLFHLMLRHIEQALPSLDSLPNLQDRIAALTSLLDDHAGLEDELLFNALEPHLGTQSEPLTVMRFEHRQIANLFSKIESATELDFARALAKQMIVVVHGHFQKEEQILFRMAQQFLSEDELMSLGAEWTKRHAPLIHLDVS